MGSAGEFPEVPDSYKLLPTKLSKIMNGPIVLFISKDLKHTKLFLIPLLGWNLYTRFIYYDRPTKSRSPQSTLRTFLSPQKLPCAHLLSVPARCPRPPLICSEDHLPFLGISNKWNHIQCVVSCILWFSSSMFLRFIFVVAHIISSLLFIVK